MGLFRRRKSFHIEPTTVSDSVTHAHVAEDIIAGGEELDELDAQMHDVFGGRAESAEDPVAAAARRAALEKEHGVDYHGFGHPPEDE